MEKKSWGIPKAAFPTTVDSQLCKPLNYERKAELEMLIIISVQYWERGQNTQGSLNIYQTHSEQFLIWWVFSVLFNNTTKMTNNGAQDKGYGCPCYFFTVRGINLAIYPKVHILSLLKRKPLLIHGAKEPLWANRDTSCLSHPQLRCVPEASKQELYPWMILRETN